MFGFSIARWSPLGTGWKGSLLAVCTMQGNITIYCCDQDKEASQEWRIFWEWKDSEGILIQDLQWFVDVNCNLNFIASFRTAACKIFTFVNGTFVMGVDDIGPSLVSFEMVDNLVFGIDVNRAVWYDEERLFECLEMDYFIKVFSDTVVLCGTSEVIVWFGKLKSKVNIVYGKLIQVVGCELFKSDLILYSGENEAFVISLDTCQIRPFIQYNNILSEYLDDCEMTEKSDTLFKVPNATLYAIIGTCGTIDKVKFVIIAKTTIHGFRGYFICSLIDRNILSVQIDHSLAVNSVYKGTLVPEKKQLYFEMFQNSPKNLFLFGTLLRELAKVNEARELMNRPPQPKNIYDICEWSGEELKSPFNLVCSLCNTKYRINAPVFNCMLCDGPIFRSKFCQAE